jgi:AP-2 complex subunit mu-1
MPNSAANAQITVGRGRARYEPGERAIVWRISTFPGSTESTLQAVVTLLASTKPKPWTRPPVTVDFQILGLAASGVQVRFLKVYDKSNYQTQRWVKYLSKNGEYSIKI